MCAHLIPTQTHLYQLLTRAFRARHFRLAHSLHLLDTTPHGIIQERVLQELLQVRRMRATQQTSHFPPVTASIHININHQPKQALPPMPDLEQLSFSTNAKATAIRLLTTGLRDGCVSARTRASCRMMTR